MRNTSFFLDDMREALIRMLEVTSDLEESEFTNNWILISAVRDQLMILGEAAKHIPPEIIEEYPDIPWSQLARTRDRLIHGYFRIDPHLLFIMAKVRAKILLPLIIQSIAGTSEQTEAYDSVK